LKYSFDYFSNPIKSILCPDEQSYCPDNETCCQLSSGQYGYFPIRSHAGQSKRISVTDRIIRPGLV
ncbi:unnamed protein product, partial [Rotaria magnacalcarata]